MSTGFFDFSFDPGKVVAMVPTLMSVACSANIARLIKYSPTLTNTASTANKQHNINSSSNSSNGNNDDTKRILMGVSLCEMVSSVAFALQSLCIPRVASHFVWAIGNRTALGVCMQFVISSYLFACATSFVYLGKIGSSMDNSNKDKEKYGEHQGQQQQRAHQDLVARRIEPLMGALGFGYPVITFLVVPLCACTVHWNSVV
jgi:hypothetical protein